jgi:hypothetical protein
MPLLVHIAPANQANAIRRSGLAARRTSKGQAMAGFAFERVLWAFPVLPSYTLTYNWARELKRTGATSLVAATFRVPDDEQVMARHYMRPPRLMTASEAAGFIASAEDPRGYEIMMSRRIAPHEILRVRPLPRAVGWRYHPGAKGSPAVMCDCPVCLPSGEVKARRFRERVYDRMRAHGWSLTSDN